MTEIETSTRLDGDVMIPAWVPLVYTVTPITIVLAVAWWAEKAGKLTVPFWAAVITTLCIYGAFGALLLLVVYGTDKVD